MEICGTNQSKNPHRESTPSNIRIFKIDASPWVGLLMLKLSNEKIYLLVEFKKSIFISVKFFISVKVC